MASIRVLKRADGSNAYKIIWRDSDTKKQTSFTTDSESEAELIKRLLDSNGQSFQLANQIVAESNSKSPTINTIVEGYLGELTGIESATKMDYVRMWENHIRESLGGKKIEFVDKATVIKWFEAIDRSPKTKKNIHAVLSSAFKWAKEQGLMVDNPAVGVSTPKGSMRAREAVFLSHAEVDQIIGELGDYGPFIELLAGTGLRYNEATALRRRDFVQSSPENISVSVSRAWKNTVHGFQIGSPKTRASLRRVTLSKSLTSKFQGLLGSLKYEELVFTKPSGSYLRAGYFYTYHWEPALTRLLDAGLILERPRIHDLRHTHASWLIDAGVPLPVIQKRLGHSSISTTIDVYGTLANDADMKAADALDL
ncbi:tyrosine-type recombinase/integrase [Glutamicibacter ardleyensis]|uniref:tyrosine-type recombinase/integrase n=1 Tax=Glutamicibacter ardleyensis TaxID=225894 RepID=UPI003FD59222